MCLVKSLIVDGYMISTIIKDNGIRIMNKGITDFKADNDYTIEINDSSEKILVILDSNLGGKNQQLLFINETKKSICLGRQKNNNMWRFISWTNFTKKYLLQYFI